MQNRSNTDVFGIDVSNHQGDINWVDVAKSGVKFVYLKLTEGQTFLDKRAYQNYFGAKNAGLRVGFYCFSHVTNDPKKEVDFFLKKLGEMKADLPHVLDLEDGKGQSKARINSFALEWLKYMKQKTGITPMLYTMYGFFPNFSSKELANYPLWIARYYDKANPGNSSIWSKWSMFQYSDKGSVKGIKGNVDVNAMSADFFKLIDTGVSYVADANPPSSFRKGDSGLGVKELQQDLMKVGYKLPKYGADGGYGDETVEAVKKFQADNKLTSDGIAGEKTLALLADKVIEAEKPANLPPVTSLGDKYSFQVKANVDTGVYTYADLSKKNRVISKDTVFSVYGYTTSAYAVGGGGFVKRNEVTPLPVTITTGGLSKDMEAEFRAFLKDAGIDTDLNVHAEGNPSATLTVAGLQLVLVRHFLDNKGWYYKN